MKTSKAIIFVSTAAWLFVFAVSALAAGNGARRVEAATQVLNKVMAVPDQSIPESVLSTSYAMAVIPKGSKPSRETVQQENEGGHGWGVLVARTADGGWSDPMFVTLNLENIDSHSGLTSGDIVLVFRNSRAVDAIEQGTLTLGRDVIAAPGPVGKAWPGAYGQGNADIYTYSTNGGAVSGVNLSGAALGIDEDADESFYGSPDIRPDDILSAKGKVTIPPAVAQFACAVARYTSSAKTCS